jgi:hypothetical protein
VPYLYHTIRVLFESREDAVGPTPRGLVSREYFSSDIVSQMGVAFPLDNHPLEDIPLVLDGKNGDAEKSIKAIAYTFGESGVK